MQVGFVGAGRIGRPIIGRLVAAGHDVRVLDRSESARAAVAGLGATSVNDLVALAHEADAVVLCPYQDAQVRELALHNDLPGFMPTGSVLIVHTTGSPSTIAAIAAGAGCGVDVVDAPISGGPADIEAGHVTLYVGATERGMARARPVLAAYADPIVHLGLPSSGQKMKLVNNAVFAANIGILADAVRLAVRLGLDEPMVLNGLRHGSGDSRALSGAAATGSVAAFGAAVGEFVVKDLAVVNELIAELGLDLGVLATPHRALFDLLSPAHRALRLTGTEPAPK
jgi:3-hydroxyisobutyrate dehydrogenase-like beta-hydroxyacid dehydrogenase